jgi:4'-phosphopantetheinyl transferase
MMDASLVRVAGPPAMVVDVWVMDLATLDSAYDLLTEPLDREERLQAARRRVDGREWAVAHGAMRRILADYLDLPAASLRFVRTALGKPRLDSVQRLEFSSTRTAGLALLAVASDRELGVDLEREHDLPDIEGVASEFLAPSESTAIEASAPEHRRSAFFAAWARLEAVGKLSGRGIAGGLEAHVTEPPARVVVRALATRPGYAAAVAAEGEGWTVRMRRFDPAGA